MTGSHTCRFDRWNGKFVPGAEGSLEKASLTFSVEIDSIYCDWDSRSKWTEKFEKHMKADDFLQAKKHPKATFVSHAIETSDKVTTVTGALTIEGFPNTISFPAEITAKGSFSLKARFDINRKKWGIEYKGSQTTWSGTRWFSTFNWRLNNPVKGGLDLGGARSRGINRVLF